jgi:hypothetical protein
MTVSSLDFLQVDIPASQVYAIKEGLSVDEASKEYEGQLLRVSQTVLPRNSQGRLHPHPVQFFWLKHGLPSRRSTDTPHGSFTATWFFSRASSLLPCTVKGIERELVSASRHSGIHRKHTIRISCVCIIGNQQNQLFGYAVPKLEFMTVPPE